MWIGMAEHFFCRNTLVCVCVVWCFLFVCSSLVEKNAWQYIYMQRLSQERARTIAGCQFHILFDFHPSSHLTNSTRQQLAYWHCCSDWLPQPWMGAVSRANFPPIFAVTFYHCHHPAGLTRQMLERERSFGSDILGQMPLAPHYQI